MSTSKSNHSGQQRTIDNITSSSLSSTPPSISSVILILSPNPPPSLLTLTEDILTQSTQLAIEKYGAGSWLVGAGSEDPDAEDLGFLIEVKEGVEGVWKEVMKALGVDTSKLSDPVSSSPDLTSQSYVPQGSSLSSSLSRLTDLIELSATSVEEDRVIKMVLGKRDEWWVGLVGVGVLT